MVCFNLNSSKRSCKKRGARAALLAGAFMTLSLMISGCSEDNSGTVPEDFTYDGTYIIREISATRDNVTIYRWDQNAAIGLLEISQETYYLQLSYGSDAFGYGSRYDQGTLVFENSTILFMSDSVATNTIPRGTYDYEKDWLRINYISSDFLWTEIWKRAEPVDESLNLSNEIAENKPPDIISPE